MLLQPAGFRIPQMGERRSGFSPSTEGLEFALAWNKAPMGETVHPNVPWGLECPLNHSKNGNLSGRLVSYSEVMAKGRVFGAEACDLMWCLR